MTGRPLATVSMDLDNLWAYLKTHGDPGWRDYPSFLPSAVPRLLDVLGEQHLKATVFVVGADAVREDGAKAVNEIVAAGHEIANHSFGHEPWLHRYSRDRLGDELSRTEDAIVSAGAPKPSGFRGPGYSVTLDLIELLIERGYSYDASTLPTWIGPLARAYHNRGVSAAAADDGRGELFGGFSRVLAPVHPYRWRTAEGNALVELPVTTMPLLRTPIHGSYLVQLNEISPRLARGYFRTALRLCLARGVTPSLLLHPTDVLEASEAPGMEFFPGMAGGSRKTALVRWALRTMREQFEVVGTGAYVRRSVVRRERSTARLDRGR